MLCIRLHALKVCRKCATVVRYQVRINDTSKLVSTSQRKQSSLWQRSKENSVPTVRDVTWLGNMSPMLRDKVLFPVARRHIAQKLKFEQHSGKNLRTRNYQLGRNGICVCCEMRSEHINTLWSCNVESVGCWNRWHSVKHLQARGCSSAPSCGQRHSDQVPVDRALPRAICHCRVEWPRISQRHPTSDSGAV
jgi:hypothetical protein